MLVNSFLFSARNLKTNFQKKKKKTWDTVSFYTLCTIDINIIYDLVTMVQSEISVWAKAQYITLPSRFKRKELRVYYTRNTYSLFFLG